MLVTAVQAFGGEYSESKQSNLLAQSAAEEPIVIGNEAEWDRAVEALVHTPSSELFVGVLHPAAALFERSFIPMVAKKEHETFIQLLEDSGIRVHTISNVLLKGTIDEAGRIVPGKPLDDLRGFAAESVSMDLSSVPEEMHNEQRQYLRDSVFKMHPRDLLRVILERPKIILSQTEINTFLKATYEIEPVMNMYFLRDQMITTKSGVVLGKMNSAQRSFETEIVRFVLEKLGIDIVYEVKGNGRLEGGDFLPAGETVFIMQGLRTNTEAIRQLLDARVFGANRVVVVKEPWKRQAEMHLDTFFNIIRPDLGVLVADRMDIRDESGVLLRSASPDKRLSVDVYEKVENRYEKRRTDLDFQSFLEDDMGMKLMPISVDDQRNYGVNFLAIESNVIAAVEGVSEEYKQAMKSEGVEVNWVDFRNLTGGYGAAHCTVQVLHRRPE